EPPLSIPRSDNSVSLAFVGRERELAMLDAALKAMIGGKSSFVFISGDAGIGKTHLVTEWIHESVKWATDQALTIRWLSGLCYELESRAPYGMWADALQPLLTPDWQPALSGLAEAWRRQLARPLPELASITDDIDSATDS